VHDYAQSSIFPRKFTILVVLPAQRTVYSSPMGRPFAALSEGFRGGMFDQRRYAALGIVPRSKIGDVPENTSEALTRRNRDSKIRYFLLALVAIMSAIVCQAQQVLLTRHVREAVLNGAAQPLGRLPATQSLHFDIVLALRNQPALETSWTSSTILPALLPAVRYGAGVYREIWPSQEDYDALIAFAKANGLRWLAARAMPWTHNSWHPLRTWKRPST